MTQNVTRACRFLLATVLSPQLGLGTKINDKLRTIFLNMDYPISITPQKKNTQKKNTQPVSQLGANEKNESKTKLALPSKAEKIVGKKRSQQIIWKWFGLLKTRRRAD